MLFSDTDCIIEFCLFVSFVVVFLLLLLFSFSPFWVVFEKMEMFSTWILLLGVHPYWYIESQIAFVYGMKVSGGTFAHCMGETPVTVHTQKKKKGTKTLSCHAIPTYRWPGKSRSWPLEGAIMIGGWFKNQFD